jgi:hypothetical protein
MQFHPDDWTETVGKLEPSNGDWTPRCIIGPYDACLVANLRQKITNLVVLGEPYPADVFILSHGEGTQDCTKIGGLPFWRRHLPWPTCSGQPLPFLAQFNFAESEDITGELPGDILLLFGDCGSPDHLQLHWESTSYKGPLVTTDIVPINEGSPAFYGVRWRTDNFPGWHPINEEDASDITLPDGTFVLNLYLVLELLGIQIGQFPFVPPGSRFCAPNESILCTIPSVFPTTAVANPFFNYVGSINEADVNQYGVPLTIDDGESGFCVLYVLKDSHQQCRIHVETL